MSCFLIWNLFPSMCCHLNFYFLLSDWFSFLNIVFLMLCLAFYVLLQFLCLIANDNPFLTFSTFDFLGIVCWIIEMPWRILVLVLLKN